MTVGAVAIPAVRKIYHHSWESAKAGSPAFIRLGRTIRDLLAKVMTVFRPIPLPYERYEVGPKFNAKAVRGCGGEHTAPVMIKVLLVAPISGRCGEMVSLRHVGVGDGDGGCIFAKPGLLR